MVCLEGRKRAVLREEVGMFEERNGLFLRKKEGLFGEKVGSFEGGSGLL